MVDTVRINLNVDPEIPEMLAALAGSQRRMGSYLSDLVRAAHAGQVVTGGPGEMEMVSGAIKHLSAKVKELDGRLSVVEARR